MDLDLDDDQAAVVDLFGSFFARESPPFAVRASEAAGWSPDLWKRLDELGAPAMAVPESVGGGGGGLLDAVLAAEQAGRHLAPVPLIEHLAALRVLHRAGADALLQEVLTSRDPITLALRPAVGGVARHVPFGAIAPRFLAVVDGQVVLVRSEPPGRPTPNGSGLAIADRSIVDPVLVADGDGGGPDEWRLLLASMLVGLADAALALGTAYVSERHQFGVPIGSFQAIQHGLAELPGPLAGIRLLVARAAWRADGGERDRFAVDATMALAAATELARTVTGRVLHYHGGYGVMEEYDIQLHHRRARGWPAQVGDPAHELGRIADLLYGPVVA